MHMLFTNFSCGLFCSDIEWQASNSSTQSMKENWAIIITPYFYRILIILFVMQDTFK